MTSYCVPFDYRLPDDSELVPDITVMRDEDVGDERLTVPPLLVVEVISPSSRLMDPLVKRAKYEQAGVPAYWIADPPSGRLTVLERRGDELVERATVQPGRSIELAQPFPVTVHMPLHARSG